jgi:hypothetical protein
MVLLSKFDYDRNNGVFIATITSNIGGDGELRITWQNNFFQEVLNQDNPDTDTVIQEKFLPYTFVGPYAADPEIRRDAVDIANNTPEVR